MDRKIALILSGCGHLDGSEITESVSCLIALSEEGAKVDIFAPSISVKSSDAFSQETGMDYRNSLTEAARIARENIQNLEELDVDKYDGLVIPGGYGVVTVLSNFSEKSTRAEVIPKLKSCIQSFHKSSKPIAAFCIAPVLLALSLKKESVAITIGDDDALMKTLSSLGADLVICGVEDYVTDRQNKIITSPAYMYDASPSQVFKGIKSAIREFIEMS